MLAASEGAVVHRGKVSKIQSEGECGRCVLTDKTTVLVKPFLARFLRPGDEIEFPVCTDPLPAVELRIVRGTAARGLREIYLAPIGYATKPRQNQRHEYFVRAEVRDGLLGIRWVHLPGTKLRDYFYSVDRKGNWESGRSLYDILRAPRTATLGDLRLAFKLRRLELTKQGAPRRELQALERAYNILGNPELRASYDALLTDPAKPAPFPYDGFGSILVAGNSSEDRQTFFASRILAFLPNLSHKKFRMPLRRVDFYQDHAVYRDSRRKVEVVFDPHSLPLGWDPTWDQWKHLLGVKIEMEGTFVQSGKYRLRSGNWELVNWAVALPSKLEVTLPAGVEEAVETARRTYERFGHHSRAIEEVRALIEKQPIERQDLRRICSEHGIPDDFDVTQINWQPDYDPYFYRELAKCARQTYLFRCEYTFDLEHAIVVEVPQPGHATYVFAKPDDLSAFLAAYAGAPKEDLRKNRDNIGEGLRFLGRVVHGNNPKRWLKDLRIPIREFADPVATGGR